MLRRILGLCAATLLWAGCTSGPEYPERIEAIFGDPVLEGIERRIGGRMGVALVDDTGTQLRSYRGDERFAMCSTFKLALSAAVLERVDGGDMSLDDMVSFGEDDLLDYAPVARMHLADGEMSVGQMAEAISTLSDNVAANLLLDAIGGPEAMTEFFRRHGDTVSRLDRREPELNENVPGDERDTTSPSAMAGLVTRLMFEDALGEAGREQLAAWAVANQTGDDRIRAGMPEGWTVGDKTGSCGTAYNDIGIVWPPSGRAFVLTVYVDRPAAEGAEVDAAIAEIAALAAFYMTERNIN
ncbi:class A beta-lactamase [Parasphingopyxis lamellibrachiae]|uniref:Beta-lactamase n=1 Tax=Parasphingopyxis lamellibrachiae TaxID=680125 RepID=A0A3D9FD09_9SPHN|nr:class A beta-lactamase [Parasphingopyxis lamellibrachiae]RED15437.1 beta-lactamase class A [Parasphingopyxis lamellibrachiae]